MEKYFHILLVLLISVVGCAHTNRTGILEKRAGYSSKPQTHTNKETQVSRTRGKVKKAWLHAHEMPTGDYFGGAWIYLLIEGTRWSLPESH